MFGPGQWLKIILVLSSLTTSDALRRRAASQVDGKSKELTLPVAQFESLTNRTTVLFSKPSLPNSRPENTSILETNRRLQNTSSADALTVGTPKYVCNGTAYGRNLKLRSCFNAIASMEEFHSPQSFGQRGKGKWDINLPFRFLSGGS